MIIAIDNGVSGSIAILPRNKLPRVYAMPVFKTLNYQKKASYITRIDTVKLEELLRNGMGVRNDDLVRVVIERPMVNPGRFVATASALRAYEATIIVLERLSLGYEVLDSKQWQKVMLPSNLKGADKLKAAGVAVARRLYPALDCSHVPDCDSLLMAEYASRRMK